MLVTLPYYGRDYGQAQKLLDWVEYLGEYPTHDLILFRESKSAPVKLPTKFKSVQEVEWTNPYSAAMGKWGEATTTAFSTIARHVENTSKVPFLFLEPDCVVFKPEWADLIEVEYTRANRKFMGAFVQGIGESPDHMSGVGVYPGEVVNHAGMALIAYRLPWDLAAAHQIRPQAHFTDLIQHRWDRDPNNTANNAANHPPIKTMEEIYQVVTRECVLFHGDKTGSWLEVLRQQRNGGDAKCTVASVKTVPDQGESVGQSSKGTEKVQAPSVPVKPWAELTKKEKRERRIAQMARARAAKASKKEQKTEATVESALKHFLPQPSDQSETSTCRAELAKYCVGLGLDIGFGGSAIVPTALTMDMNSPYTHVGGDKQILRGNAGNLSFFCDEVLDYIFSSHLLEDFTYDELANAVIPEWRRVLKTGGVLITNCPDQQRFLAHCAKTGQGLNMNHKEQDFSLNTFRSVLDKEGSCWETVYEKSEHGPYSWLLVVKKIA